MNWPKLDITGAQGSKRPFPAEKNKENGDRRVGGVRELGGNPSLPDE
jgi:hypothetical protein